MYFIYRFKIVKTLIGCFGVKKESITKLIIIFFKQSLFYLSRLCFWLSFNIIVSIYMYNLLFIMSYI